jgi:hydroxymethylpyrimidine pyrophosphatase-like HAD family hydrolase
MLIAVDFDGTLFKWAKFPDVGEPVPLAVETCLELHNQGHELILWTCRKDDGLNIAIKAILDAGLWFHYYNEYPGQDHLSNKLDADILIDDKAFGCPLITHEKSDGTYDERPYVDWEEVRWVLKHTGVLK